MLTFLANYGLFLAKTVTIVLALLIIIAMIIAAKAKAREQNNECLQIKKLNEKYDELCDEINDIILSKAEKKAKKAEIKKATKQNKSIGKISKRIFVIYFDGDIKASAVDELRETITAVLLTANKNDAALVCLESAGGLVNAYGLASSQLQRLRDAKIHLTVAIDKVAASGGYMMACVADNIIAAPFAIIGSIGVLAQLPNLHRFLKKRDIDFEQLTAGEYKRTLTVFGENTSAGREKLQEEINETHGIFKTFIKLHRPQVDIDAVATGEHWLATQCIDKKLVDQLQTSDDYLLSKRNEFDLYEMEYKLKPSITKRISAFMQQTLHALLYDRT